MTAAPGCPLPQVEGDKREREGRTWAPGEEGAFKSAISARYDAEGHPYYSSARLWDDGVIDPVDTRRVLGLSFAAAIQGGGAGGLGVPNSGASPFPGSTFGVFRM